MKNKYLLSVCAILFGFVISTPVKAQVIDESDGEVVWLGSTLSEALNGQYVYLYSVQKNMFINAGGAYGVQGVLSTVGMRMKIENSAVNGCYRVASRIDNQAQGNYMSPNGSGSTEIYLDRIGTYDSGANNSPTYSCPEWQFSATTRTVRINGTNYTTTTFTIYNYRRRQYLSYDNNNRLVFSNTSTQWRIVTEADYVEAMNNVVWGEVDLGSFVQDAEFGRDNLDGRYWVWEYNGGTNITTGEDAEHQTITLDAYDITSSPMHWHQRNQDKMCNGINLANTNSISRADIGRNVAGTTGGNYDHDGFRNAFARYYAAEIYNEQIKLSQTAELSSGTQGSNLSKGLYKMTCQALYYDGDDGMTNDDVAYFFVKRVANGEETTETLPIIPMNKVPGNNITPHSGVSAGYVFDTNAKAYLLEFYIEVKENTTLTFGIEMKKPEGWTVLGNIHLYAHGKQAIFLDEDWTGNETVDYTLYEDDTNLLHLGPDDPYKLVRYNDKYDWPVTLYYQRTMTKNAWNTICLPINLTGSQVRTAFGPNCDLAEIDEIEVVEKDNATGGHYTIHFKGVDLDTEGLMFGKPYIIKPTIDPQEPNGTKVEVGNGGQNQFIQIEGPTYTLGGVTKDALLENQVLADLAQTITGIGGIKFTGSFYAKDIEVADVNSDTGEDCWFITKGNMYHLRGGKSYTLWSTYAYLHMPKSSTGTNIMISVDGVTDTMTSIDEMPIVREGSIDDASIYNLAGQKMESSSLSTLPRGIYIVNGRKYSVK